MLKLHVTVCPAEMRRFRRQAIRHFPREILALMVGDINGRNVHIYQITTPPLLGKKAEVEVTDEDWEIARLQAKKKGLQVIGSIHTHPFNPTTLVGGPSTWDVHSAAILVEKVWAICNVWKPKDRKRFRTSLDWFGGGPEVEVRK